MKINELLELLYKEKVKFGIFLGLFFLGLFLLLHFFVLNNIENRSYLVTNNNTSLNKLNKELDVFEKSLDSNKSVGKIITGKATLSKVAAKVKYNKNGDDYILIQIKKDFNTDSIKVSFDKKEIPMNFKNNIYFVKIEGIDIRKDHLLSVKSFSIDNIVGEVGSYNIKALNTAPSVLNFKKEVKDDLIIVSFSLNEFVTDFGIYINNKKTPFKFNKIENKYFAYSKYLKNNKIKIAVFNKYNDYSEKIIDFK